MDNTSINKMADNRPTLSPENVLVRAQDTPNPNAIKFIVNFSLKDEGNATFYSADSLAGSTDKSSAAQAESLPLVRDLLNLPGVEQIYLFQNTVTVTHNEQLPTDILKDQVASILRTRMAIHKSDFAGPDQKTKVTPRDRSGLPEDIQKIEEILDRTIRPGLQSDGGDVEVLDFAQDQLKISYQGACGGCPSSMMGTLEAIQSILRNEMQNENITVHVV